MLIASRALQGIAGATLAPATLSLIFNMFQDPRQRTIAVGVWIMGFSAGGAVGPVLGGVLLEHFWWGSVFLLALPVMGLLLVLGPRLLAGVPRSGRGAARFCRAPRCRWLAILAVIFGFEQIARTGPAWCPVASIPRRGRDRR